jgi:hypothetical protein
LGDQAAHRVADNVDRGEPERVGEGVAQGRVVVIQGAHEVLDEHQRRTPGDPEAAVGEACPAALGDQGWGRVMRELSHDASVPAARGVTVSAT